MLGTYEGRLATSNIGVKLCSLLWVEGKRAEIFFGPAHPSAHGVLRSVLVTGWGGESLHLMQLCLGLLHRGTEKLMEARASACIVGLTGRLDYVSSHWGEVGMSSALENTGGTGSGPATSMSAHGCRLA